ncbi:MAG: hypothetical protein E7254_04005 [Lachnospiraceae bacterium]|nr:hypothetical protein [Lachnospiraceae bacterium]
MKNSKLFTNAVVAGLALSLSITGFSGVSGNAEIVKSFNSPSKDNANSNITITATCRNLLQTTDIEAGLIELNAETLTDYIDYHEVDNASNDSDKKEKNTKQTKKTKKRKNKKKKTIKKYKKESKELLGTYKVTAYCGCSRCCGKATGITASGTRAKAGRTIAADTSKLPFGTKVEINGHTYTVEDRGGAINGNKIDVFFNSHQEALNWGVRYIKVYKVK